MSKSYAKSAEQLRKRQSSSSVKVIIMNASSLQPHTRALKTLKGQQSKECIYHFENKFKYFIYIQIHFRVQEH